MLLNLLYICLVFMVVSRDEGDPAVNLAVLSFSGEFMKEYDNIDEEIYDLLMVLAGKLDKKAAFFCKNSKSDNKNEE